MKEITFFSIPKPFAGHIEITQRNAIHSWQQLTGAERIYLFGDEAGLEEFCAESKVRQTKNIRRTSLGTPLLSDAFNLIQQTAETDLICYVNTDIILLPDFQAAVDSIQSKNFLMVGRRWNLDIENSIDFSGAWESNLRAEVKSRGVLFTECGIDFFVFRRGTISGFPDFAVGRPGWDNWLIYHARKNGVHVIDATEAVTVIHQNHDYSHVSQASRRNTYYGPEAEENLKLVGSDEHLFTINDATRMIKDGKEIIDFSNAKVMARMEHQEVLQKFRPLAVLIKALNYLYKRLMVLLMK